MCVLESEKARWERERTEDGTSGKVEKCEDGGLSGKGKEKEKGKGKRKEWGRGKGRGIYLIIIIIIIYIYIEGPV